METHTATPTVTSVFADFVKVAHERGWRVLNTTSVWPAGAWATIDLETYPTEDGGTETVITAGGHGEIFTDADITDATTAESALAEVMSEVNQYVRHSV